MTHPDAASEIQLVSLLTVQGANFWSSRPVTRLDLIVGAYDDICSADVPGFTESLVRALPGLVEHRCSIGERGGFITRLRCGTYAPHIIEHIALELQSMVGHEVGYGRARDGDRPGQYTVVFEHLHTQVGLRAAVLAMGIVQRAFAGTLGSIDYAIAELRALPEIPDVPPLQQQVFCGIIGGTQRMATRDEIVRRGVPEAELVVEVMPAYLLNAGLPYARSEAAVILDAQLSDVPERYREPDRARRLVSVLVDAVPPQGIVLVPADDGELQELVRDTGRRTATFAVDERSASDSAGVADTAAYVQEGRIVAQCRGRRSDLGPVRADVPVKSQAAAALLLFLREETRQREPVDDDLVVPHHGKLQM
jgi:hypothetical protein